MSIYDRSDYKRGGYSGQRTGGYNRGSFQPKKPVHTFRDLEVYQKAMDCAVLVSKDISPKLVRLKYPMLENMVNCALSIPLYIGEGHSMRFDSFAAGIALLEKAMAGCNKMIVYLEQVKGLYGIKLDGGLLDDLIGRYVEARSKMFRLSKSWKKFHQEFPEGKFAAPVPKL
jgi:23S rRNA-intervening sequence protein